MLVVMVTSDELMRFAVFSVTASGRGRRSHTLSIVTTDGARAFVVPEH